MDTSNNSFDNHDDDNDAPVVGAFPLPPNPAIPPTDPPFKFKADEAAVASSVANAPCCRSWSSRIDQRTLKYDVSRSDGSRSDVFWLATLRSDDSRSDES